jgi:hypothetical protein
MPEMPLDSCLRRNDTTSKWCEALVHIVLPLFAYGAASNQEVYCLQASLCTIQSNARSYLENSASYISGHAQVGQKGIEESGLTEANAGAMAVMASSCHGASMSSDRQSTAMIGNF